MFSLLEKPQQSAPAASGTVPSATPLRGAVGARESSAVAEAPTSSAGAASTTVPAAAPAIGGTVFPTASVGGAARAPAPADETAAAEAAPSTGDTTDPDASVERAAKKLPLEESPAGATPSDVAAEAFLLAVRYYNSSLPKHGNNSNSSNSSKAAATAAAAATTPPATTTHGGKRPMLEYYCDPLIRGRDASGMYGEENRFSVWISILIAGNHGGECSMEGDGLHDEVINDDLEFCIWEMSRQGGS